jgi:hypothetical protein
MGLQRFSIDDAREPFDVDMASKMRLVEEAGRALIVCRSLVASGADAPPGGISVLEALSHACQEIASASALVGARSLEQTARLLASMAAAGTPALGEACVEGAEAMRRMLALELRNRGHEAWAVALALRECSGWQHARESIEGGGSPKPPNVDAFSFDDEPRLPADAARRSQARAILFPRRR